MRTALLILVTLAGSIPCGIRDASADSARAEPSPSTVGLEASELTNHEFGAPTGNQIRFRASISGMNRRVEGRFVALTSEVLVVEVDGRVVHVPRGDVDDLEVRTGGSGTALAGAFAGLAVGILVAMAAQPDRSSESGFLAGMDHMEEDIYRGFAIVLGGVAIGTGVGAALDEGTWRTVPPWPSGPGPETRAGPAWELGYSVSF